VNKLLRALTIRCAKPGGVWDYFYVGVIGYGATVGSAFTGSLAGSDLAPISRIANTPSRIEDRKQTGKGTAKVS
jgi:hypothetical protein